MSRDTQRLIARLLAGAAAIATFATIGVMIVGYSAAVGRIAAEKQRIDELTELAREDDSQSAALVAEWDRQTEASLERDKRVAKETRVLVISAVLLLIGAKWSVRLGGRRVPTAKAIAAHRAIWEKRASTRRRRTTGPAEAHKPCDACKAQAIDLGFVDEVISRFGRSPEATIPILQAVQDHYRYLHPDAIARICALTEITPARIAGVASFYTQFRHSPVGRHIVKVCHGTACHVAGAQAITDELRRELGIAADTDTDPTGEFTVEQVACMGCCTLAPVAQIDDATFGHLSPDAVPDALDAARAAADGDVCRPRPPLPSEDRETAPLLGEIRIGLGSCCVAGGSGKVHQALEQAVAATGSRVHIKRVGCVGMCHQTPLVETVIPGKPAALYAGVGPENAAAIVLRHFRPTGTRRRITAALTTVAQKVRRDGQATPITERAIELRDPPVAAFLGPQKHIATEHCGQIDPTDLDEYLRNDGFKALAHCVNDMSPEDVIAEVSRSGLRGRGGAGFPTGLKWSRVREAKGELKYIICNGDEGDPGAFMDRMLMESFPFRVIEGIAIAAFAVGAREGYLYIRAEYPLAVERIRGAIHECEQRGYLGDNILGTGLSLRLNIMEGAGAFVCGEETALLASIEGKRGSPRLRPPFPADQGLRNKPTLVNNVETYTTLPWIIRHGADSFAALGTDKSKGTKVFALAGKVKRGGLIEVPMGVTVRRIVEEIGGGIKDDRQFKAVQIGGPSGGCVPAFLADTPVDYEALAEVGAIMGSGGLVVLDDTDCMVDIARYFLAFTQDHSCGKCTYCRIGTRRMLDILNRICEGRGHPSDLDTLEELAHAIKKASLCGLGKTAPNPVLSTLRYFREEYEAHLDGRCPAGKCKALITYRVTDACTGCTLCAQHCPDDAIGFTPYRKHEIDAEKCTRCDICRTKCPEDAIEVV